jgi:hypothetical protein
MFKSDSTIANSPVSQFRKHSNRARTRPIGRALLKSSCDAFAQKIGQPRDQYQPAFSHIMELSHSGGFQEDRNSVLTKILIALHITNRYRLENHFAGNWASGNSEVLPDSRDQIRAFQLAISKGRFQRTQNRRPLGTFFRKCREERLKVLLDVLRQMTAGFSG